jgi:hypothetical protein
MSNVPYLDLTHGYPRFRRDIRRRLRQGSDRMTARYGVRSGLLRTDRDPAAVAALRTEITSAWLARNLDAGRDTSRAAWDELYDLAREVVTLRVGGELAAWVLARPGDISLDVLAGQMVPGFEDLFPGRAVEAFLVTRAVTDRRHEILSWGDGSHPGSLIAVS